MRQQHSSSARPGHVAVPRWRSALDTFIGAPTRLHRYRHLHAEVIEDALRAYDCSQKPGTGG